MSHNISIEEYTPKSFVVRGETQPHKESLKGLGGKWNSSLTDRNNGEKFGAWLFWSDKRNEVNNWLKKGCQIVEQRENIGSVSQTDPDIIRLEKKVDHLIHMMESFFSGNVCIANIKQTENHVSKEDIEVEDIEVDDIDDKNIFKPVKRLLGRSKKQIDKYRFDS